MNTPRPGRFDIDMGGEAVAVQFADDPQIVTAGHQLGVDGGRAGKADDRLGGADPLAPFGLGQRLTVLAGYESPIREGGQPLLVVGRQVIIALVRVADYEHARTLSRHLWSTE